MRHLLLSRIHISVAIATLLMPVSLCGQESVKDFFFIEGAVARVNSILQSSDLGDAYRYYSYNSGNLTVVLYGPLVKNVYENGNGYSSRVIYNGEISRYERIISCEGNAIFSVATNGDKEIMVFFPGEKRVSWTESLNNTRYDCAAEMQYVIFSSSGKSIKQTIKVVKRGPYRTSISYWAKGEGLICRWERGNDDSNLELIEAVKGVNEKSFKELTVREVKAFQERERKEKALQDLKEYYELNPDSLKIVSSVSYEKIDSVLSYYSARHIVNNGLSKTGLKLKVDVPHNGAVYIIGAQDFFDYSEIEKLHEDVAMALNCSNRTVVEPKSGETVTVGLVQDYSYSFESPREYEVPVKLKKGEWIVRRSNKISIPQSWISIIPVAAEVVSEVRGASDKIRIVGVSINKIDYIFVDVNLDNSSGKVLKFVGKGE